MNSMNKNMTSFDRPFAYLLWKDKSNEANLTNYRRLKDIEIPDTVVLTKSPKASSTRSEINMEWFFYSRKLNAVLKRLKQNVNITTLENFFLKSKYKIEYGADIIRPVALDNATDYRLMKDTLVGLFK